LIQTNPISCTILFYELERVEWMEFRKGVVEKRRGKEKDLLEKSVMGNDLLILFDLCEYGYERQYGLFMDRRRNIEGFIFCC
jgi:hypothetical protein